MTGDSPTQAAEQALAELRHVADKLDDYVFPGWAARMRELADTVAAALAVPPAADTGPADEYGHGSVREMHGWTIDLLDVADGIAHAGGRPLFVKCLRHEANRPAPARRPVNAADSGLREAAVALAHGGEQQHAALVRFGWSPPAGFDSEYVAHLRVLAAAGGEG